MRHAWQSGISVIAVTDHDTVGGIETAELAAAGFGVTLVHGIEMTAIERERDIHVLGYFLDVRSAALGQFLARQQLARVDRLRAMALRLATLGRPVAIEPILEAAASAHRSVGRPVLARAMVAAGHVTDIRQAFDLWLAEGRPAHVPRAGASVREVVDVIHRAGGLASLAHPAVYACDDAIEGWVADGLDAVEVYHREHDAAAVERYRAIADRGGLLVTGGSDYHGDERAHRSVLGGVTLPDAEYFRLVEARGRDRGRSDGA
jgi:predicted metal-dependent phosphoesterase TrpH